MMRIHIPQLRHLRTSSDSLIYKSSGVSAILWHRWSPCPSVFHCLCTSPHQSPAQGPSCSPGGQELSSSWLPITIAHWLASSPRPDTGRGHREERYKGKIKTYTSWLMTWLLLLWKRSNLHRTSDQNIARYKPAWCMPLLKS